MSQSSRASQTWPWQGQYFQTQIDGSIQWRLVEEFHAGGGGGEQQISKIASKFDGLCATFAGLECPSSHTHQSISWVVKANQPLSKWHEASECHAHLGSPAWSPTSWSFQNFRGDARNWFRWDLFRLQSIFWRKNLRCTTRTYGSFQEVWMWAQLLLRKTAAKWRSRFAILGYVDLLLDLCWFRRRDVEPHFETDFTQPGSRTKPRLQTFKKCRFFQLKNLSTSKDHPGRVNLEYLQNHNCELYEIFEWPSILELPNAELRRRAEFLQKYNMPITVGVLKYRLNSIHKSRTLDRVQKYFRRQTLGEYKTWAHCCQFAVEILKTNDLFSHTCVAGFKSVGECLMRRFGFSLSETVALLEAVAHCPRSTFDDFGKKLQVLQRHCILTKEDFVTSDVFRMSLSGKKEEIWGYLSELVHRLLLVFWLIVLSQLSYPLSPLPMQTQWSKHSQSHQSANPPQYHLGF